MRRYLIVSLAILGIMGLLGGLCEGYNGDLADRCTLGLLPVERALDAGDWAAAKAQAERLAAGWKKDEELAQLWVNHADTDAVNHALTALILSLSARDALSARLALAECMENFAHLHHRDAFTLKNIL